MRKIPMLAAASIPPTTGVPTARRLAAPAPAAALRRRRRN
jgi:hypothetical protein